MLSNKWYFSAFCWYSLYLSMEILNGLDNVLDNLYWVGFFFACVDEALLRSVTLATSKWASYLSSPLCLMKDVSRDISRRRISPMLSSPFETKTGISLSWVALAVLFLVAGSVRRVTYLLACQTWLFGHST